MKRIVIDPNMMMSYDGQNYYKNIVKNEFRNNNYEFEVLIQNYNNYPNLAYQVQNIISQAQKYANNILYGYMNDGSLLLQFSFKKSLLLSLL